MLGSVVEFLEQRQVDVSLDIAHRAGISVPVPGPPEITAVVDDANVAKARLVQAGASQKTAEATAGDHDLGMIIQRCAREVGVSPGIPGVVRELALDGLDVLTLALVHRALVALVLVLLLQRMRIKLELADSDVDFTFA